ncbi:amidohydrolase family protein [Solirubrobacter soli]|uniref:amidohydrolase family protein n=1 Tax=Solirubrobacter soli TaxID=363832 RepID=UPI000429226F|nr:amidohydrolase family protein [Solirubrobacter soli]
MPIFDAHFHVIDPRFPLVPNQGFLPEPFTVGDYRERVAGLDVTGGAVVSGSFQAYDQTYLVDALQQLGPGFVGVANVPSDIADAEVVALAEAGVRAYRVNLFRGGDLEQVALAPRFHDLVGWHLEVYLDARDLPAVRSALSIAPRLVIDHVGMSQAGLPALLDLVKDGAYVKASGFGRIDVDPYSALKAVAALNPEAVVFGSDLPGTRARRPFLDEDLDLVAEAAGERALYENGVALYR